LDGFHVPLVTWRISEDFLENFVQFSPAKSHISSQEEVREPTSLCFYTVVVSDLAAELIRLKGVLKRPRLWGLLYLQNKPPDFLRGHFVILLCDAAGIVRLFDVQHPTCETLKPGSQLRGDQPLFSVDGGNNLFADVGGFLPCIGPLLISLHNNTKQQLFSCFLFVPNFVCRYARAWYSTMYSGPGLFASG
jgi:hypothetical protein